MAQIVGSLLTIIILCVVTLILYKRRVNERPDADVTRIVTEETLDKIIKDELADALKEDDIIMTDDVDYEAVYRNRRRLEKANTESTAGIPSARKVMLALIRDILERELPTRESICNIINFDDIINLDPMIKFEILILKLYPKVGKDVIKYLEKQYRLTEPRVIENGYSDKKIREFDYKLLDYIFSVEVTPEEGSEELISYKEALDIMAIRRYQKRGFGPVDTLVLLNIDGMNLGVSGSIRYEIDGDYDVPYRTTNSCWVQIDAKWVLFSFIDFHTIANMKKIINQLVSWESGSPMTERVPYKVCTGYDGSRRVAIRPSSGEAWAFMLRKFVAQVYTTEQWLNKPGINNWQLPYQLIYYLMKSERTTAFSGYINTGKTTAMRSAIEFVELRNIRVIETAFELALREIYKNKNIFSVKPTDYVTSSTLQDLLKKMDGYMSLVGEVAEDLVAARMIQFCLVASAFTIFSGHWLDDDALINGLANSLVASKEYGDHNVAKSIVLDVIHHNIHYGFSRDTGERVIMYISEITKMDEVIAYPEIEKLRRDAKIAMQNDNANALAEIMLAYTMLTREYYTRSTDRVRYETRKIITFNEDTMTYEPGEWYSAKMMEDILRKLSKEDRAGFIKFYKENWRR